jgi:hypothetical protein
MNILVLSNSMPMAITLPAGLNGPPGGLIIHLRNAGVSVYLPTDMYMSLASGPITITTIMKMLVLSNSMPMAITLRAGLNGPPGGLIIHLRNHGVSPYLPMDMYMLPVSGLMNITTIMKILVLSNSMTMAIT